MVADNISTRLPVLPACFLPEQIITRNEGGSVSVVNAYSYNTRRMVSGEAIVQPGWPTWSFGYGYNANGHLAVNAYPGGVVDYAPNALGQVRKAGPYAANVTYYPNGAMHQFTYGNGIVHTMQQNERGFSRRRTAIAAWSSRMSSSTLRRRSRGGCTRLASCAIRSPTTQTEP